MGVGDNQVCVFAINVKAPDTNPLLGCRTTTVRPQPIGAFDSISVTGGSARVSGWTLDPNSPAESIPVHIYVTSSNNQVAGYAYLADDRRPDGNSVLGVPGDHGFSRTVQLYPGSNSVCAFGISTVSGDKNALLGCRTVASLASIGGSETPAPLNDSAAPLTAPPTASTSASTRAPSAMSTPHATPMPTPPAGSAATLTGGR
jgi:hypothetical protein